MNFGARQWNYLTLVELLIKCNELFKTLFPKTAKLSQGEIQGEYAWEAREWALLNESAGIIYMQKGEVEESRKAFVEAKKFFILEEDLTRLEKNRLSVEQTFKDNNLTT